MAELAVKLNDLGLLVVDYLYKFRIDGESRVGGIRPAWQACAEKFPGVGPRLDRYACLPNADVFPFGSCTCGTKYGICDGVWTVKDVVGPLLPPLLDLMRFLIAEPAYLSDRNFSQKIQPHPGWWFAYCRVVDRHPIYPDEMRAAAMIECPE